MYQPYLAESSIISYVWLIISINENKKQLTIK